MKTYKLSGYEYASKTANVNLHAGATLHPLTIGNFTIYEAFSLHIIHKKPEIVCRTVSESACSSAKVVGVGLNLHASSPVTPCLFQSRCTLSFCLAPFSALHFPQSCVRVELEAIPLWRRYLRGFDKKISADFGACAYDSWVWQLLTNLLLVRPRVCICTYVWHLKWQAN